MKTFIEAGADPLSKLSFDDANDGLTVIHLVYKIMKNALCPVHYLMEKAGRQPPIGKYHMKDLSKVLGYLLDLTGFKDISEVPLDVELDFTINAEIFENWLMILESWMKFCQFVSNGVMRL